MQKTFEKSVDVEVPVSTAYNQWTQFESFPNFMVGVESITQISDTRTHWITNIGGVKREFDAEITEQHPDERVVWQAVTGPIHSGVVTFHHQGPALTRVRVQMVYKPEGAAETVGAATGVVGGQLSVDLDQFKEYIESHGRADGAWRGDIPGPGIIPGS